MIISCSSLHLSLGIGGVHKLKNLFDLLGDITLNLFSTIGEFHQLINVNVSLAMMVGPMLKHDEQMIDGYK